MGRSRLGWALRLVRSICMHPSTSKICYVRIDPVFLAASVASSYSVMAILACNYTAVVVQPALIPARPAGIA